MKRSLLFVLLSGSGFAAVIGTCVPSHMGALVIGNPCAVGDQMFSNFTDTGDVEVSRFQMANAGSGAEFRRILAPLTGSGFFSHFAFTNTIGVIPDVSPADYRVVAVTNQANFSRAGESSGWLVADRPGPTFDLAPGRETGDPLETGPGSSSFQFGYIQANIVPEPASLSLIGLGLAGLALLRKRLA